MLACVRSAVAVCIALSPLLACGRSPAAAELTAAIASAATPRRCEDARAPEPAAQGFAHHRSGWIAAAASPHHVLHDGFANPGASTTLLAKITYGELGKDLEDEAVTLWIDTCDPQRSATAIAHVRADHDGLARFTFVAPSAGTYRTWVSVDGDGTLAAGQLFVWAPGTAIVVSDIDGTLTTTDDEVTIDVLDEYFEDLREGEYAAAAYPGGAELTHLWHDAGVPVVYLTGRPYWLVEHTRTWLHEGGHAPGLVHTTARHRDVVPNADGVGAFKAAYLRELQAAGLRIVAAYGNASTDVAAYAAVELAPAQTFIIGPHAGEGGTVAVHGDWAAALPWARDRARAP